MATIQTFKVADSSTLARFKEWAQDIGNALAALGWVKVAETGTVDWAIIGAVPANASPVFEVWRMADSLQATAPFFIKLEYGQGTTAGNPSLWITGGTGTNGSGQLTGAGTRQQLTATAGQAAQGATQYEMDYSGSTSRFNCVIWRNLVTTSFAFGIERSRDTAGAETDESVTLWSISAGSTGRQQTFPKLGTGASIGQESFIISAMMTTFTSSIYNNKIAIAPVFPFLGYYQNPMTSIVALKAADWVDGALFDVVMYGATRRMMVSKNTPNTNAISGGCMAMRWD